MISLTRRQQVMLDFIDEFTHENGYAPTLREIGAYMNIRSTNGVSDHLKALERKGYLKREGWATRAMSTTSNEERKKKLRGTLGAARGLIESTTNIDGSVTMSKDTALRVAALLNDAIEVI